MSVSTQQAIRELSDGGMSDRQIAKQLGLSRNTVAKYVEGGLFAPAKGQ